MAVVWTAPSRYMNQCWNIINWAYGNKFQWNLNQHENAIENFVWKMAAILSQLQCVSFTTGVHFMLQSVNFSIYKVLRIILYPAQYV